MWIRVKETRSGDPCLIDTKGNMLTIYRTYGGGGVLAIEDFDSNLNICEYETYERAVEILDAIQHTIVIGQQLYILPTK